jgi:3'-5' exoribonuclease
VRQKVDGILYLARSSPGAARNGKWYLSLTFRDLQRVSIDGKLWDYAGETPAVGVYRISAAVEEYKGAPQLVLARLPEPVPDADPAPYLAQVRPVRASAELLERLLDEALGDIKDRRLSTLLANVLDEETRLLFLGAPAATTHHGCFPGGLAFHALEVRRIALELAKVRGGPRCNLDLLAAGALLHDVGKIDEMEFAEDRGGAAHRREAPRGRLYGHMPAGLLRAHKQAVLLGIDEAPEVVNLFHLIISHHGEREWGAPAPPMTQEARFLHAADEFASKVEVTVDVLEEIHTRADGDWREGGRNRPRLYLGFDARRGPRSGQR